MPLSTHSATLLKQSKKQLLLTFLVVVAGLVVFFWMLSFANNHSDDVRELTSGNFMSSESDLPPATANSAWQTIKLPDYWWGRGLIADSGWYRFTFSVDSAPEKLQGVYLSRLHMNAAIYFNGELLGDGGRMDEPIARNWNRPLYFNIPKQLWHQGRNELLVHLRTYPGFGMMAAPQIADDTLLKPRYQWRQFLQNELSLAFTVALLLLGLFTLSLWLKRRGDKQYLWFACSCFCWTIFNSSLYVRYAPFDPVLYQKLTHVALDFWMVGLVGFIHRTLNYHYPNRERALLVIQSALAVILLSLPMLVAYNTTHLSHVITLLMAIYLTCLAWQNWWRQTSAEALAMAGALTALVFAGLHDWLMENPIPGLLSEQTLFAMWRHQFHLLFFMVPLLAMFFAWHLTQRFIRALNEAESLNKDLESRVTAAQHVLSASFEELRVLEMTRAAEGERERIYRDLHDDVGAKLLGLAISAQRANQIREADLARSALQDLRDVVSRSAHAMSRLDNLIADLRAETEQRLNVAGVRLGWQIPDFPEPVPVSAAAALNISRILREAVSNALRHANASCITVDFCWCEDKLRLTIADNGIGLPPSHSQSNRGMSSMRTRALALGGSITWLSEPNQGCSVVVTISLPHISPDAKIPLARI